jgi:hypothetical protein
MNEGHYGLGVKWSQLNLHSTMLTTPHRPTNVTVCPGAPARRFTRATREDIDPAPSSPPRLFRQNAYVGSPVPTFARATSEDADPAPSSPPRLFRQNAYVGATPAPSSPPRVARNLALLFLDEFFLTCDVCGDTNRHVAAIQGTAVCLDCRSAYHSAEWFLNFKFIE